MLSALPTILPEEAYEWLPAARRTLERLDGCAALREPFAPAYDGLKRKLPALSGPPFEEVCFCYSESLGAEDVEVTAQAAATRIYFDLALLPGTTECDFHVWVTRVVPSGFVGSGPDAPTPGAEQVRSISITTEP